MPTKQHKNAPVWKEFKTPTPTKVDDATIGNATEVARYDLMGRKLTKPSAGINIVRYSNGTTTKEIVNQEDL